MDFPVYINTGYTYRVKALVWLVGIVVLLSCSKKFVANKPTEYYNKLQAVKEPSSLNILAYFHVKELQKSVNTRLPALLYEDNNIEDDDYIIRVLRKGDIRIIPKNGYISVKIPLDIYAKTRVKIGFLKPEYESRFEVLINYASKISASPDWKIITTTTGNGFDWIIEPKIKIGPLEINISSFVEHAIMEKQDAFAKEIDRLVAEKVSLKEYIIQAWNLLQTPLQLDAGSDSWVKISPSNVVFIPPFGDTTTFKTGIQIKGIAETFFGRKPTSDLQSLPLLEVSNAPSDSFRINLSVQLSFAYASKLAKESLKNKTFAIKDSKKNVNVTDIEIYGSGDKVIAKTTLAGDFEGIIYLAGKPQYDSASASVLINNLDFSLDTKNKLLKAADWLAHGFLLKKLEKEFRFPVKPQIDEAKKQMNQNMSNHKINPYLTLNGRLNEVNPKKLFIVEDYFLLLIEGKGNLNLNVSRF